MDPSPRARSLRSNGRATSDDAVECTPPHETQHGHQQQASSTPASTPARRSRGSGERGSTTPHKRRRAAVNVHVSTMAVRDRSGGRDGGGRDEMVHDCPGMYMCLHLLV